jgi:hypothetical protein
MTEHKERKRGMIAAEASESAAHIAKDMLDICSLGTSANNRDV